MNKLEFPILNEFNLCKLTNAISPFYICLTCSSWEAIKSIDRFDCAVTQINAKIVINSYRSIIILQSIANQLTSNLMKIITRHCDATDLLILFEFRSTSFSFCFSSVFFIIGEFSFVQKCQMSNDNQLRSLNFCFPRPRRNSVLDSFSIVSRCHEISWKKKKKMMKFFPVISVVHLHRFLVIFCTPLFVCRLFFVQFNHKVQTYIDRKCVHAA